jgi:hypothetical protein
VSGLESLSGPYRRVCGRRVDTSQDPGEPVDAVLDLVAGVVVGVGIQVITVLLVNVRSEAPQSQVYVRPKGFASNGSRFDNVVGVVMTRVKPIRC